MYRENPVAAPWVVTAHNGHVSAFDRTNGRVKWQVALDPPRGVVRLHVDAQRVVALGIGELAVMEYATGKIVMNAPVGGSCSLLVDGDIAIITDDGIVTAIDLATGRARWTNRVPNTGRGVAAIGTPNGVVQADDVGR